MQTERRLLSLVSLLCVFCAATAITSPAQTLTTLVTFDGNNGANPWAPLVQGSDGNFYGTTITGYGNPGGWLFKMTPSGNLTTLYNFCSQPNCADGDQPFAGLIEATDGNFYGTTAEGGASGCGTIFKMTPQGTVTTLHSFDFTDGAYPFAPLLQASDGNLYGITTFGGANNAGTIFKTTLSGALTTIYNFCSLPGCADGQYYFAAVNTSLVQATDGNVYGTTTGGGLSPLNCGSNGCGTIFKLTLSGTFSTLYKFCSQSNCADGYTPQAGLVQATDGNFYGTTTVGGANSVGTVFQISPSGTLTTLHSFNPSTDGYQSYATLLQATDGNLYGTTESGGLSNSGALFKVTPSGTLTTLHLFCSLPQCADGSRPYAGLIQATDGNLYGTTAFGGSFGDGTVFRLSGPSPNPLQFVQVTPCRAVDTRPEKGGSGPIPGGTFQDFPISGAPNCGIPASAAAYSLNVTVVPQGSLGYLTIWPAGQPRPVVSTMNSVDGRVKADAAIVPAGSSGEVSVYVTQTTNVVLDINGYFEPVSGSTLAFYPLTPCRIADTRYSTYPQGLGPPSLTGGQPRAFPVLSSTCIPTGVNPAAYSFNFTVVPGGHPVGYLSAWPTGQSQPVVSTLNDQTGTIVANAAIVPAGTGGDISVYSTNDTQLLIDINGYFAPAGPGGLSLYPVAPCRVIDTRHVGSGQPFSGTLTPPVDVTGSFCEPPVTAQAYVFNATVVPTGALGYLTLWPDGTGQPVVSTLNAFDGALTNNMAIVPTNNGKVDAFANGLTQLILDISSYFAP